MELTAGRIPLNSEEAEAVDSLLDSQGADGASLMRRDAGETGPVLVCIGDQTWEVESDGMTRSVA